MKSFLFNLFERARERAEKRQESRASEKKNVPEETETGDALARYYRKWQTEQGKTVAPEALQEWENSAFSDQGEDFLWEEDGRLLRQQLLPEAERRLSAGKCDGKVVLMVTKDRLAALLVVLPPLGGGKEIEEGDIVSQLLEREIIYGVQQDKIQSVISQKQFLRCIVAARGQLPGRDGKVIDCFPRKLRDEGKLLVDEHGVVDYKDLNRFSNVEKGTVICKIIPPVANRNGVNVFGEPVTGNPGRPAMIPRGENTEILPDGSALVASVGGHLSFENDRFNIQSVLEIEGDVDTGVGNLDFYGDIIIHGDIRNGFTVKAKGNIMVDGMVEDAIVVAGGGIAIAKGMNGNGHGSLESKAEIKCKFLENCTVFATGSVIADSIICCDLFCDDQVIAASGKGVIIGGTLTVLKSIDAHNIGSRSNRVTEITLGTTPHILERKKEMEADLEEARANLAEINKDIAYLEPNESSLNEERRNILEQLRIEQPPLAADVRRLTAQLQQLEEDIDNVDACRIRCDAIYPRTKINIAHGSLNITDIAEDCLIYYSSGNVILGKRSVD